jgi:hypothetical protein
METFSKRFQVIKSEKPTLKKRRFGMSLYKSLGGFELFTLEKFFIEI